MKEQEVFDRVARHLLKQNAKATSPRGGCSYRTKEGLSCAVGCLLTKAQAAQALRRGSRG